MLWFLFLYGTQGNPADNVAGENRIDDDDRYNGHRKARINRAIYYGGAETVTALAFAKMDAVLDFVKITSEP